MRKCLLFSVVFLFATQVTDAQNVTMSDRISEGNMEVVPQEVTGTNKSYMAVYNFKEDKPKSELMIALSRTEIAADMQVENYEKPHEYWLKNDGGNWVADNEHTYYHQEYDNALLSFCYQDPDNSFYPTAGILASQTIFNSDDKWEYVVLDVEIKEKSEIQDGCFWEGVKSKYVEQYKVIKGYKIMNQNGQVAYIPVAKFNNANKYVEDAYGYNLSKFGDLLYMTTIEMVRRSDDGRLEESTGMYVLETSTTKVQSAMRVTNRVSVSGAGGAYSVKVEDARNNEKIILTDMNGRTISSAPASEGLYFQSDGSKIYNVTLSGDKTEENVKFLGE